MGEGCAPKVSSDAVDAKCEGCPSSKVIRGRRRLSPPVWVAAFFLRVGHLLHLSMGYYWEPGRCYFWEAKEKNERRETGDLDGGTT